MNEGIHLDLDTWIVYIYIMSYTYTLMLLNPGSPTWSTS